MTSWPRPVRLFAALAVVPAVALGGLRAALVLAFAGLVTAEAGTRRAEGQRVFPPFTTMFTPVWIAERAVSAWLALGSQIVFKGIRSRGLVLPRAATPWRERHQKGGARRSAEPCRSIIHRHSRREFAAPSSCYRCLVVLAGTPETQSMPADPVRVRDRRTTRLVVSLAIVLVVFAFALPKVASLSDVWTQIGEMSVAALVILLVASAWNLVTYAFVLRAATPGLTYSQAVVVTESSTAVANTMPGGGALGVGVTAAMYRSWGFGASTTSSAVLLTGIWSTLVKLGLPILALAVLATQGHASLASLFASLIGVGALAATVCGVVVLLHSDSAARRVGGIAAHCASRFRRVVRRPAVTGWKDAASEFRTGSRLLLRRSWLRLTITTVVSQLSLYVVLLLAVRGAGISSGEVGWAEVLTAFAFVRLLSTIPLTPGGLGVVELGLTGALVGFGGNKTSVVAAVLLFRALTYLAPIVVGSVTYFVWRHRSTWRMPVEPSAA